MLIERWTSHTAFVLTFTPKKLVVCSDATKLYPESSGVFNTLVSHVLLKCT